ILPSSSTHDLPAFPTRRSSDLGFPALATTSAGFAFSQGLPDSGDTVVVGRDETLAHIASITAAVDLPVSADFMSGYGLDPEDVRSEEHTSELQSRENLVCRLLL